MADFKDLVAEFDTVTTNFTSTNTFIHDEFSAVDWNDRGKSYPLVLFDAKSVDFSIENFNNSNLPVQNLISGTIHFFDVYNEGDKATTSLAVAQNSLQILSNQWFAELMRRTDSSNQGMYLANRTDITGTIDYDKGNDMLTHVTWNFEMVLLDTTCSAGSFTGTCDDATVQNSDLSYTTTVASGATLNLPDIIHIDSDGTPTPTPAQNVFTCTTVGVFADASVDNTTGSYHETLGSGGTLILPDILHIDSDGSPVSTPAQTVFTATTCAVFADSSVDNTNGSYHQTLGSGGTLVIPDSSVTSSAGGFTDSFPSTETYTIADTSYTDGDGSLLSVEYGTNPVCTADTFTMLFYFIDVAATSYTRTIVAAEAATYTSNTLVNVTSVVYKKNTVVATLPITLAATDTLEVIPTITTSGTDASVQLDS